MLQSSEEEREAVTNYFHSQSKDARVSFLQKVYSESILSHRHDVWDVHATDGRWWIVTNPTNLYSQDQFPNMDLAVTFHMGLCLRIPRTSSPSTSVRSVWVFGDVLGSLGDVSDALRSAHELDAYRGIGVRCRECLLAFVAAAQDAAEWTDQKPKRADFRIWAELICNKALPGSAQKERRHLLKTMLNEAWTYTNWLTHAHSATWQDAEIASSTTEHVLGIAVSLVLRHIQAVPEQCPRCSSPSLSPQEGFEEGAPEVVWERPVCDDCGWTGKAVPVGERDPNDANIFIREGNEDDSGYVPPKLPLTHLIKPR